MQNGLYRHFKGKQYRLLCIAKHSETEEEMVVYQDSSDEGEVWVRPLSMWKEMVEHKDRSVKRFEYIGDGAEKKHFVYIVLCADNSLYTGWTTDIEARIKEHNCGSGAKYTRSRRPVSLVYQEAFLQKSDALKREIQIKKLSKKQKLNLLRRDAHMNSFIQKLENPIRIKELDPEQTLKRIGVSTSHTICDLGAGSGVFTIPAARMTKGSVYAVEINDDLLGVIQCKAEKEGLQNIIPIKSDGVSFPIPPGAIDLVLLVTVLHEIKETTLFLESIKKATKKGGRLAVIEFVKRSSPMGPDESRRISNMQVSELMGVIGFALIDAFDLGENLYCAVYQESDAK